MQSSWTDSDLLEANALRTPFGTFKPPILLEHCLRTVEKLSESTSNQQLGRGPATAQHDSGTSDDQTFVEKSDLSDSSKLMLWNGSSGHPGPGMIELPRAVGTLSDSG